MTVGREVTTKRVRFFFAQAVMCGAAGMKKFVSVLEGMKQSASHGNCSLAACHGRRGTGHLDHGDGS